MNKKVSVIPNNIQLQLFHSVDKLEDKKVHFIIMELPSLSGRKFSEDF